MNLELKEATHPQSGKKTYTPPVLVVLSLQSSGGVATNRIAESTDGHGPIGT